MSNQAAHLKWRPVPGSTAVVVGAGKSGLAAARLLAADGVHARLLESNPDRIDAALAADLKNAGIEVMTGSHSREQFSGASLVIPSPGMPLLKLLEIMGEAAKGPDAPEIMAETEFAYRHLGGEGIAAVTGTSGKTTTVSLIAAMLREGGKKVFLGGNIGTPLSEYILGGEKADVVVLELSSFQLQACTHFHAHVAAILNITPNHLDYHKDMAEYTEAKFRIFRNQTPEDLAILSPALREEAERHHLRSRVMYFEACGRFRKMQLIGRHNEENAEVAWQVAREFGVDLEAAERAVESFKPIPHRLERVCEKHGVLYVNDSKATTVSSLETALKAMNRPVLLLCGGKWKGGDLKALIPLVREKVRCVAGFGASREVFESAWKGVVPMEWYPTLKPAVESLYHKAVSGDVILLSPATASFDLYKGMAFRGQDFKNIVGGLA